MYISVFLTVILSIGTILTFIWLLLFLKSKQYNQLVTPLDMKEFILKEIYPIGLKILEIINYQYKSKGDRKLKKNIEMIYGEKYSEYYLRIICAQRIAMSYTLFIVFIAIYALAKDISILYMGVLFSGLAYYYSGYEVKRKVTKREESIMQGFPDVISKLALLTNAGMIIRESWEKIACTGNGAIYKEMLIVVDEVNNGISEVDAYFNFGMRCNLPEIKKFTSSLVQGMTKGNQEIANVLRQQNKEIWEIKKHNVRQQGEKAASKLMIPVTLMFVGILIMVIVPIFTNLGK